MTNKEAIKWLIRPTITTTGEAEGMQKKQLDAYYMAIKALQEKEMYDNIPNNLLAKDEKKALSDQCAKNAQSDLISRADAIKTVISWLPKEHHLMLKGTLALEDIVNALYSVPSVSAERVGEWLHRWSEVECSNCGEFYKEEYNYCPNCGVRMASK